MRWMFALYAVAVIVSAALGPAFAHSGPSVCQYRDGVVLNAAEGRAWSHPGTIETE